MDVDLAIKTAAERLGFKKLKEKQIEAIKAFISGKDVFVSLPTGYGKSLIYGILPLVFNILEGLSHSDLLYIKRFFFCFTGKERSIIVCVSPLTSLVMDQKSQFTPRGVIAGTM